MYSVKEVAEILGVSVHTVRYYDDCGLIPGVVRNNSKNRQFTDEALDAAIATKGQNVEAETDQEQSKSDEDSSDASNSTEDPREEPGENKE